MSQGMRFHKKIEFIKKEKRKTLMEEWIGQIVNWWDLVEEELNLK